MVSSKLYNVDMSDTKTRIVLGVAAAGTALALGGAMYYMSSSEGESASGNDGSARDSVGQDAGKIGSVSSIGMDSASVEAQSDVPIEKQEPVGEEKSESEDEPDQNPLERADKRKAEGNAFFKKKEYNEAKKCYLEAADMYPEENAVEKSHCYQNMAATSEKLGKPDDVVQYCTKALTLNQKYVKAIQRRATAYEKLNKYEESIKDWTAVCLIEGPEKSMKNGYMATSDRVLKAYGDQSAKKLMASRKPRLPSHTVIKSALDNIHMRDFKATDTPDSLQSIGDKRYIQILSDIEQGNYSRMADRLDSALKENPVKFLNQLRCFRGIFAWVMTDYATAISNFDDVIRDSSSLMRLKVQAYIHRGEVYQLKGDKNRALADFNHAVQIDEDHPDAYLHRAQFYLSLEGLDQAIKDLKKSIELDEDFPAPWTQLVYGQYQMARTMTPSLLNEVFSNLSKMEEKFPKVADVFALYGQVLQDQRQFSAAEEKFNEAQRLAPENVTYMAHVATLKMMAENNFDSAMTLLKEAYEKDPKCDFVLENLGMIYIQKQMYDDALECFKKALDLVKTEAEAAHLSALRIGIQCQAEVCKEYDVKPVSMSDIQDFSQMTPAPQE